MKNFERIRLAKLLLFLEAVFIVAACLALAYTPLPNWVVQILGISIIATLIATLRTIIFFLDMT